MMDAMTGPDVSLCQCIERQLSSCQLVLLTRTECQDVCAIFCASTCVKYCLGLLGLDAKISHRWHTVDVVCMCTHVSKLP